MKNRIFSIFFIIFFSILPIQVFAHVPYLEINDFSENQPFEVKKSIEQSIAVYSWLEYEKGIPSTDIDVFRFTISKPSRVYIEVIVPVCNEFYKNFVPWFALVGPNLPDPIYDLPFDIPEGYGAIVKENVMPGEDRETFYEPFGGKSYYKGQIFDKIVNESGTYYAYYWDPYETGGDYVAVFGRKEQFGFVDILRALVNTPLIRMGYELHLPDDVN